MRNVNTRLDYISRLHCISEFVSVVQLIKSKSNLADEYWKIHRQSHILFLYRKEIVLLCNIINLQMVKCGLSLADDYCKVSPTFHIKAAGISSI